MPTEASSLLDAWPVEHTRLPLSHGCRLAKTTDHEWEIGIVHFACQGLWGPRLTSSYVDMVLTIRFRFDSMRPR
jgi:hypothetical protein